MASDDLFTLSENGVPNADGFVGRTADDDPASWLLLCEGRVDIAIAYGLAVALEGADAFA